MEIRVKPTEDILAYVAALPNGPFCVGFAAESEDLAQYAQAKRVRKKIPMIVANLVQHAVGKDENEVTIYDDDGAHALARAPKSRIAHGIVAHALRLRQERRAGDGHADQAGFLSFSRSGLTAFGGLVHWTQMNADETDGKERDE